MAIMRVTISELAAMATVLLRQGSIKIVAVNKAMIHVELLQKRDVSGLPEVDFPFDALEGELKTSSALWVVKVDAAGGVLTVGIEDVDPAPRAPQAQQPVRLTPPARVPQAQQPTPVAPVPAPAAPPALAPAPAVPAPAPAVATAPVQPVTPVAPIAPVTPVAPAAPATPAQRGNWLQRAWTSFTS